MEHVSFLPASRIGREFIPGEWIPEGKDEYYLRDQQIPWPRDRWRHLTSDDPDTPEIPPMGARFRLKAEYDISGYPAQLQVILQAMKTYGMILADNGSDWYVSGAPNESARLFPARGATSLRASRQSRQSAFA